MKGDAAKELAREAWRGERGDPRAPGRRRRAVSTAPRSLPSGPAHSGRAPRAGARAVAVRFAAVLPRSPAPRHSRSSACPRRRHAAAAPHSRPHREATESRSGLRGGGRPQPPMYPPWAGRRHGPPGLFSRPPRPMFCGGRAHARPRLAGARRRLHPRQPPRPCARRAERRSGTHRGAGGRSPHGAVVYSRNPALALVPASNQKLPVACGSGGARAWLPVPHGGLRQRHARRGRLARQPLAARVRRPNARARRTSPRSRGTSLPGGSDGSTER